jgi:hypothetical protein
MYNTKFVHFRKENLGKLIAVILCVLMWVQASLLHHYVRQFWMQIQTSAISRTWEYSIIYLSSSSVLFSCPAPFCSHRFAIHLVIWCCVLWRQWDLFLLLVSTLCVVMRTECSTVALLIAATWVVTSHNWSSWARIVSFPPNCHKQ